MFFVKCRTCGSGRFVMTKINGSEIVGIDVDNEFICVRPAMWIDVK